MHSVTRMLITRILLHLDGNTHGNVKYSCKIFDSNIVILWFEQYDLFVFQNKVATGEWLRCQFYDFNRA